MATDFTRRSHERLAAAFDHFNARLFGGGLPPCLLTFHRSRRARGYFWRGAVKRRRGASLADEIALNPETFPDRSDRQVMSTLVHEMSHLWQAHFGRPGRRGYHNREWADKMEAVGLKPSHTGEAGGKRTGESMTHYIIPKGPFAAAWNELLGTGFRLEWEGRGRGPTDRSKVKYTCPCCLLAVWGRPGLDRRLGCLVCRLVMREAAG